MSTSEGSGPRRQLMIDGNEAAASVAHRTSEVIAIYPITPSSSMGELSDEWSSLGQKNVWGTVPEVVEMQSEGGAAGAVHGALQAGALTTTFTASQGLLLMIPNMYKIAGELTPYVMHVAARAIASHALSIFGDHSDVMACRQTGFALLASNSVQEAHDFAAIALAASLRSRVPFLHFFDGFRTSHEVAKIEELTDDDLRAIVRDEWIAEHRRRALDPDRPVLRGSAQNPDAFFQAREASNRWYDAVPGILQQEMDRFGELTGRRYRLFDYFGHPEAERVIVLMGSGVETVRETVEWMLARGEKVGVVAVRLFRPFALDGFVGALPKTVRSIAVLDRTKEPGGLGDPLYLEVVAAIREAAEDGKLPCALDGGQEPRVVAGRYGLSSKEFTPAMVASVYAELAQARPRRRFTVGIVDDVTHLSLDWDRELDIEPEDVFRGVFWGLGSDGTVGANKNSIKIIGEETDFQAQGYFVYDSKKAGAVTVSHLRFGPRPIRSAYLVGRAQFVACHQWEFLDRQDVLAAAAPGAVFLLNSPWAPDVVWDRLPREVQQTIVDRRLELYVIDAYEVAKNAGMGRRINTVMQTCFFAISGVLPREEAIACIKHAVEKTYAKKGAGIVQKNFQAIDDTLAHLHRVAVPAAATSQRSRPPIVSEAAPEFVQRVTAVMLAGKGDLLPVSAFTPDGTWPTSTAQWEKRAIAQDVPVWDPKICIQCNQCTFVCPHAAIRAKAVDASELAGQPGGFLSMPYKAKNLGGLQYVLQVAPEDCTGCGLCVEVCPAKDRTNPKHKAIEMVPLMEVREREKERYEFFLGLPEVDRSRLERMDAKASQFLQPLFEYSGACAGCGETPYVKLLTQLFGDRLMVANATGCSSIYGGNLPTTPYTVNHEGRGPAWSNSLFEDNAEFGLGLRLGVEAQGDLARHLVRHLAPAIGDDLAGAILETAGNDEATIRAQRERVAALREKLRSVPGLEARRLEEIAGALVPRSVWIVGGDGWAYDIGYGGLDHVLASGRNVNLLVLDTEVYSNTGGQASKATPIGAAAKFAAAGKELGKKDLGLLAMAYGHVYVARIAFGSKINQTVQAFLEAEAYPGPSLIIAYSHCIAHGYDLVHGVDQQAAAVSSGVWPLYRFDPRRAIVGEAPLQLDSAAPRTSVADYMKQEARFLMVEKRDPERYRRLVASATDEARRRWSVYQQLAGIKVPGLESDPAAEAAAAATVAAAKAALGAQPSNSPAPAGGR